MLELCKNHDIHIVNGRFGADCKIGQPTYKDASVLDYAIASPQLLLLISDYIDDHYDLLMSDVHCPITLTLCKFSLDRPHAMEHPTSSDLKVNCNKLFHRTPGLDRDAFHIKWRTEQCTAYKNRIDINAITLRDLKNSSPKEFWKILNNVNKIYELFVSISLEDFTKYFKISVMKKMWILPSLILT